MRPTIVRKVFGTSKVVVYTKILFFGHYTKGKKAQAALHPESCTINRYDEQIILPWEDEVPTIATIT